MRGCEVTFVSEGDVQIALGDDRVIVVRVAANAIIVECGDVVILTLGKPADTGAGGVVAAVAVHLEKVDIIGTGVELA